MWISFDMSQLWWPEAMIRSLAELAQGDMPVWIENILISSTGSSCSVVRIA